MKFTNVVIVMCLLGILTIGVSSQLFLIRKLDKKVWSVRSEAMGQKFISDSFRNTCNGKGFSNLNEWQVSCRELFGLEYIAWSDAGEFLDIQDAADGTRLVYGKWIGDDWEGEVYCRDRNYITEE